MKQTGLWLLGMMLALSGCGKRQAPMEAVAPPPAPAPAPAATTESPEPPASKPKISLSGAWALYPMAVKWAEEYQKTRPGIAVEVSAGGAGKGMADALAGAVDLGMVSREINQAEKDKGAWWVSVVKDAVLPTLNGANPAAPAIMKRGLTRDEFREIWIAGTLTKWNTFAEDTAPNPVRPYTRSDACGAAETWAKYLGGNQEDLKGTGVYGDPGLAQAVRKDPLAVGFNNLSSAYDLKTGKPVKGIRVAPIDLNGNRQIDPGEDFYATQQDAAKAIADGRYPSPPARPLHLVSRGKPEQKEVVDFLVWVLTDGQAFVMESGYINLPEEKLKEDLKKLE